MNKFVPYEKLSKRRKREIDRKRRGSWGEISPVTRRSRNAHIYDRKKAWDRDHYPDTVSFFVVTA